MYESHNGRFWAWLGIGRESFHLSPSLALGLMSESRADAAELARVRSPAPTAGGLSNSTSCNVLGRPWAAPWIGLNPP